MVSALDRLSYAARQTARVAWYAGHYAAGRRILKPMPKPDFPIGPTPGRAEAFAFVNRLRLIRISNNLGDAKSLITHPATNTHQRFSAEERARLGITDDLLRLSVGLEDPEDLIGDLDQALAI